LISFLHRTKKELSILMLLELERPTVKTSAHALDTKNKLKSKKYLLQLLPPQLESISSQKYVFLKRSIYSRKKKAQIDKEVRLKVSYLIDITSGLMFKYYYEKKLAIRLSSEILREKYGTDYNHYLEYLNQSGVLKLIHNYCKQRSRCKTFELSPELFVGTSKRFKNYDSTLLKKYKINVSNENDTIESNIEKHIQEKLVNDLFYISIDKEQADDYVDKLRRDIDVYNSNRYAIDCIHEKHIHYHFDEYGRFHTNFTRLKSYIRKTHLMIDGEEVCEVDISNSQPLFLTKIIDAHELNLVISSREYELFKFLTHEGLLYQHLMDCLGIKDKKEVKTLIYKVFFGTNHRKAKEDNLFHKVFPTIHDFIKTYKNLNKNHRTLAHELQRAESQFIFNEVIKEIMTKYPDVKLFTIHDSIVFPKKWKSEIESIFNNRLEKTFGKVQ
jgi:hypothetical protein